MDSWSLVFGQLEDGDGVGETGVRPASRDDDGGDGMDMEKLGLWKYVGGFGKFPMYFA